MRVKTVERDTLLQNASGGVGSVELGRLQQQLDDVSRARETGTTAYVATLIGGTLIGATGVAFIMWDLLRAPVFSAREDPARVASDPVGSGLGGLAHRSLSAARSCKRLRR